MSIASYAELKTAVSAWLHRGSSLDTVIPDFITFGEARIYRDLRIKAMETALSSTIASGVIAVPDGYIELKHAYINGAPVQWLGRKDSEWIYANYPTRSSGGTPKFIAREADSFIFGPYPDSGYTVNGIYYKRLTALSTTNTTNWFTANAPDLLLFATLCEAAPYMVNDARIPLWEGKYETTMKRIQREDDQESFSGSTLSISTR